MDWAHAGIVNLRFVKVSHLRGTEARKVDEGLEQRRHVASAGLIVSRVREVWAGQSFLGVHQWLR